MKIGLFYGSSTCYTEMVAEQIRDFIGEDQVTLHNLRTTCLDLMQNYDFLILGIPTWDFGELQEDWEALWPQLASLDLRGKIVALFGLGDQISYCEWFLDAMGILHDKLLPLGVTFIGYWPCEGYECGSMRPLTRDKKYFVGLALDEVNQFEKSQQRIHDWCVQILTEASQLIA